MHFVFAVDALVGANLGTVPPKGVICAAPEESVTATLFAAGRGRESLLGNRMNLCHRQPFAE